MIYNKEIINGITISYTNDDLEYIDDIITYFKDSYKKVLSFFSIEKLDKPLKITLWNDSLSFIEELSKITGHSYPMWASGNSINMKNESYSRIDILNFDESKKIKHQKNDTILDLKKRLVHEFVHICHIQSSKYNKIEERYKMEGVATYLSNQYEDALFDVPIYKILMDKETFYYQNYRAFFNLLVKYLSKDQILKYINNPIKDNKVINQILNQEYLNQDIDNPKYLFHGSPKKLDKLIPIKSHDSNNSNPNIAKAVFLFPSFIKSTPYAFKDTIKEKSSDLDYNFNIPNDNTYPLMTMENVRIDEDIIGYIYVFLKDDDMIKDKDSYQYKCYKELIPYDIIKVHYKDFKDYYKINNEKKR